MATGFLGFLILKSGPVANASVYDRTDRARPKDHPLSLSPARRSRSQYGGFCGPAADANLFQSFHIQRGFFIVGDNRSTVPTHLYRAGKTIPHWSVSCFGQCGRIGVSKQVFRIFIGVDSVLCLRGFLCGAS